MKTKASTLLLSLPALMFAAACGGPPRSSTAPSAANTTNDGCTERIRVAIRAELADRGSEAAQAHERELLALAEQCTTSNQWIALRASPSRPSEALRTAWQEAARAHPDDAHVQGNLAAVLLRDKDHEALVVLERAEGKWPEEMRWPKEQAHFLSFLSNHGADAALAAQAYVKLQRATELTPAEYRFDLLGDLSIFAFEAGQLDDARRYAEEILAGIGTREQSWNTGNLIHEAHTTLGRVALRAGDVATAKAHLLAAGKTPGSPQLDSFGPDFTLAVELLDRGERKTVDDYLALVDTFWEMGHAEITLWRAQLARGELPNLR
ncbi:MAG TPA: hypothetical protein VM261_15420 [Kofleriaceae bacterium]|nr:hypothetical protein [Kofleriaceae bacterium]